MSGPELAAVVEAPAVPAEELPRPGRPGAESAPAQRSRTIRWDDPVETATRGATMTGLAYMRAIAAGEVPPPPIAAVMNMDIAAIEEGRAVFEGEPGEEHYNPIGIVHGGYASTLLDSALGSAVHTTLDAGAGYATQTLEVKMVRPITREISRVRAEARVDYRGRRQATASATLTDVATGRLLATATSTCMILG